MAAVEQGQLALQVRQAVVALGRGRPVGGRGAADRRGDPGVAQAQAVAAVLGLGLIGVAGPVQGGEEPIAGAVAGEDPAGAVGAVRGRGEADDYQPRRRVAEAVDRPRPVVLAAVAHGRVGRGCLAPPDQPRAAAADVDLGRQRGEVPLTLGGGGCRPVA